jgi:hypothetical protein
MTDPIAPYAKAVIGAILAALSVLSGYLINDTGLGDITAGQWVAVLVAFLVSLGAIYAVPNKPATTSRKP